MSARCACCGGVVPVDIEAVIIRRRIPRRRANILRALSSRSRRLTAEQLAERIYADDPDGGPEMGGNTVHSHISHLKKDLKGEPLEIMTTRYDGYLLVITKGKPSKPTTPRRTAPPPWEPDEVADLKERWPAQSSGEIGRWLGRSAVAVRLKANQIGLPRKKAGRPADHREEA